jgi:cytochrome c551/c552
MKPNGDFDKMEPFMANTKFNNPIDMEVGPDGLIYVLEYGSGWFSKNENSGLARLDYIAGNLPPKVGELQVEKLSGQLPYTLKASIKASDPERGELTYVWSIGGTTKETKEPRLNHTFDKAGEYEISVLVKDNEDGSVASNKVMVYAGNEQPQVTINIEGNKSFYFPGRPISYDINVVDKGDQVDLSKLVVSTDYIEGTDLAGADLGHQVVSEAMMGESIMLSLDCKSCHKTNETSVGPSYMKVSQRYQKDPNAYAHLTQKVIKGGSGVWGEVAMPAHPDLKESDSKQIVQWILSLANSANKTKSLPDKGKFIPVENVKKPKNSVFAVTATYADKGAAGVRPLSATSNLYLRSNRMDVSEFSTVSGFPTIDSNGSKYLAFPANQAYVRATSLDLTGIKGIELSGVGRGVKGAYKIEIRTDGINGEKIGEGIISFGADKQKTISTVALQSVDDKKQRDLYIVSTPVTIAKGSEPLLKTIRFIPK